jgi:hypothetical protein
MSVIEKFRQRYAAWRARGRSREGFFRLVCRGFDDVVGECGGKCLEREDGGAEDLLYLDRDLETRWSRDSVPDFGHLNQIVSGLGLLGEGSPLDGGEDDEVWPYAILLVAEKALAYLAQTHPSRPELLLALGRVKARLHRPEEAEELHAEARRAWEKGRKRMGMGRAHAAI